MNANEEMSSNEEEGTIPSLESSSGVCGANTMDLSAFVDTVDGILPKCLKSKYDFDSDWSTDEGDESTFNTFNTASNSFTTGHTFDRSFDDTFDDRTFGSSFVHTLNQTLDNQTLDSVPEYPCDDGVEVQLAADSRASHVEKPDFEELLGDIAVNMHENVLKSRLEDVNITTTTMNTTLDSKSSLKFSPWLGEETTRQNPKPPAAAAATLPSSSGSSIDTNDCTYISKTSGIINKEERIYSSDKDKAFKISEVAEEGGRTVYCRKITATQGSVEVLASDAKEEVTKTGNRMQTLQCVDNDKREKSEPDELVTREAKEQLVTEIGGKKTGVWKTSVKGAIDSLRITKKKGYVRSNSED